MSQQINLFNPIFLKQKKVFSAVAMAQALGVIALGCGALVLYANKNFAQLKADDQATSSRLAGREAALAAAKLQYGARTPDPAIDLEITNNDVKRASLKQVFAAMQRGDYGNPNGYSGIFRALGQQRVNGVWLTAVSVDGNLADVGIEGRTTDPVLVPAYIARLGKEPVLQGKSFGTLKIGNPVVAAGSTETLPYLAFALKSGPPVAGGDR